MKKILIICGPTATGKTSLGIHLAKKLNGEIISADSRQVYKGLDIITGKDISKKSKLELRNEEFQINNPKLSVGYRSKDGIPIWLVDIAEPDYVFNVGEYKQAAKKILKDIWSRNKLPIIVGGTGLYIRVLQEPLRLIDVPPDETLRKELEKMNPKKLAKKLAQIDPKRLKKMNNSDSQNPRRLVRAIEISTFLKNHPDSELTEEDDLTKDIVSGSTKMIGLTASKEVLEQRIYKRVQERMQNGAEKEAQEIFLKGINRNFPAISSTGLKQLKEYIDKRVTLEEAVKLWQIAETQYARRQMTWFKKESEIVWFDVTRKEYELEIEQSVTKWYTP